jgi:DNA-binding HxlR family transcriptional regulator
MDMTTIPPRPADLAGCRKVNDIMGRMGDKWTTYVITELRNGPLRFNELKRRIGGISQQMLTRTLKALERDGLVTRTVVPSVPVQVSYELTELGRSLSEPLIQLGLWVVHNLGAIERSQQQHDAGNDSAAD